MFSREGGAQVRAVHRWEGVPRTQNGNNKRLFYSITIAICSPHLKSIIKDSPSPFVFQATEQAKRYASLASQCSAVSPQQDLVNFVRLLAQPSQAQKIPRRAFAPPQAQQPGEPAEEAGDYNVSNPSTHTHTLIYPLIHAFTPPLCAAAPQEMMPLLRNELVFDRHSTLSQRSALESLKREAIELELQIRQLQVSNRSSSSSTHTPPLFSLYACRTPLMH